MSMLRVFVNQMFQMALRQFPGLTWEQFEKAGDNVRLKSRAEGISLPDMSRLLGKEVEDLYDLEGEFRHLKLIVEFAPTAQMALVWADSVTHPSFSAEAHCFNIITGLETRRVNLPGYLKINQDRKYGKMVMYDIFPFRWVRAELERRIEPEADSTEESKTA